MDDPLVEPEALMKFLTFVQKHHIPIRSAYNWKESGVLPAIQVGRVIMIRESEALASLEKFKRKARREPGKAARPKKPEILEPAAAK